MSINESGSQPCGVCGEPTVHGADVDSGEGWKRVPVCDTGCLQELMYHMAGGAGSQLRSRYPSAEDA